MSRFSAVIMCLMAAAVLAEHPEVTGTGLIQKDRSITPEAPAAEEAEAAPETVVEGGSTDPAQGPGVLALKKIAEEVEQKSTHEITQAGVMNTEDDNSLAAASAAREKALAAGQASIAHTTAENSHKEAKELAAEAATTARRSINANKQAAAAKERFDSMQQIENAARVFHSEARKEYQKSKVAKETISMRVKALKDDESFAQLKKTEAEEKKKSADDFLVLTQREKDQAEEEQLKAQTAAKAAKDAFDLASQKYDTATNDANQAMTEATAYSTALGQEQAKVAKKSVEEAESEKEKKMAMEYYEEKLKESLAATERATEDEAKAQAAVQDSKRLADDAAGLAAKVGVYADQNKHLESIPVPEVPAAGEEVAAEPAAAPAPATVPAPAPA